MAGSYRCQHDGQMHHTYGEMSLLHCGHDGTVHLACDPRPAPAGTPRPDGWPIYLGWPFPLRTYRSDRLGTVTIPEDER